MTIRATAINPTVLVWARERAGLSLAEVAERLGRPPDLVAAWERGEDYPAYGQLETLAESIYKRPVALFFLSEPPEEAPVQRQFRTLPEAELESLGSDTRYALRDTNAFLLSLRELTGGRNTAERLITKDLRASARVDVTTLARSVREYLGITLATQQSWSSAETATAEWRAALERVGVFIFKRSFRQREVSGFCVEDPEFPVIVVNNSTPFTRQVFTLFHELAHLLFGVSSITKEDPGLLARFAPADRAVEMACNRFAAEFLVPEDSIPWSEFSSRDLDTFLENMAAQYNVSREVILRRLLDRGLVGSDLYAERARQWSQEPARGGSGRGGGNYYATQASYFSSAFLGLAFSQFHAGRISLPELAEHLRMKARNVGKLEDFLFARG